MVYLSSSALSLLVVLTGMLVWQWQAEEVLSLIWWQACLALLVLGTGFCFRTFRSTLDWIQIGILLPVFALIAATGLYAYGEAFQIFIGAHALPWKIVFTNGVGWAACCLGLIYMLEATSFLQSGQVQYRAPWQLAQRVASRYLIPHLLVIVIIQGVDGAANLGAIPYLIALWFMADLHSQSMVANKEPPADDSVQGMLSPQLSFGPYTVQFSDWIEMAHSPRFHFLLQLMVICGAGARAQYIRETVSSKTALKSLQTSS